MLLGFSFGGFCHHHTGEKVPVKEHPTYAKYFKMLQMGVAPPGMCVSVTFIAQRCWYALLHRFGLCRGAAKAEAGWTRSAYCPVAAGYTHPPRW